MTDWLHKAQQELLQIESARTTIDYDLYCGAADEKRIATVVEHAVKAADEIILELNDPEDIDVATCGVVHKLVQKMVLAINMQRQRKQFLSKRSCF